MVKNGKKRDYMNMTIVETEYEYKNNLALRQPTTISINTILYIHYKP